MLARGERAPRRRARGAHARRTAHHALSHRRRRAASSRASSRSARASTARSRHWRRNATARTGWSPATCSQPHRTPGCPARRRARGRGVARRLHCRASPSAACVPRTSEHSVTPGRTGSRRSPESGTRRLRKPRRPTIFRTMMERAVSPDGVIPVVNGEERTVAAGSTLGDLLARALRERGRRGGGAQSRDRARSRASRLDGARHRRLRGDRALRRRRMTAPRSSPAAPTRHSRSRDARSVRASWSARASTSRPTEMVRAIEASGAEVVTVAVRRVDLESRQDDGMLHHLDPNALLPAREHRGLLHRGRRDPLRAARARRGIQRVGEARGHRRPGDAAPRHGGAARGDAHARGRRLQGARVHERRSHHARCASRMPAPLR